MAQRTINTGGINISQVRDSMLDSGIDLDADMTEIDNPDWVQHSASGELKHQIYVHQVPEFVAFHAENPDLWGQTLCLLGPTAVGKTEGVRQGLALAAKKMGRRPHISELHVSQMGPVDALGVPRERESRTYWAPPEIWPLSETLEARNGHTTRVNEFLADYKQTGSLHYELLPEDWYLHFHDEVTNPSSPQVPHQLFPAWCGDSEGRMIAGHRLVPDYFVVLAGNRVADGTNSINLAASAVTRLGLVEVVPHYGGWLQNYAFKDRIYAGETVTKIHPLVISYLNKFNSHFAPQDLDQRSPMDPFPTPRGWSFVSDILYANDHTALRADLLKPAIAGRIGDATAQQFFTFVQHYKELPDVDKLLRGDPIPNFPSKNRPDLLAILGTHMVMKLRKENSKIFMKYMLDSDKFGPEVGAMIMKQLRPAGKLVPLVREWASPEFSKWTSQNRNFVF